MKRMFCTLLAVILLTVCVGSLAAGTSGNDEAEAISAPQWEYSELDDGTLKITGVSWSTRPDTIEIPNEIDGKAVTVLGNGTFSNIRNGGTLSIPQNLKEIEPDAFSGYHPSDFLLSKRNDRFAVMDGLLCDKEKKEVVVAADSVGTISIPEGIVSIGNHAFRGLGRKPDDWFGGGKELYKFEISETVKKIGDYAFASVICSVGYHSTGKLDFKDPDRVSIPPIETIGEYAFSNFEIGSDVPKSSMGKQFSAIFGDTSTSSFVDSDFRVRAKEVKEGAFQGVSNVYVDFLPEAIVGKSAFESAGVTVGWLGNIVNLSDGAFTDASVTVSGSMENLQLSFSTSTLQAGFNLPIPLSGNVKRIESGAYQGWNVPYERYLPKNIEYIADDAITDASEPFLVDRDSYAEEWCIKKQLQYNYYGESEEDNSWLTE